MPQQEQELRSRTQKQPNSPPAKSKVESNKSEKKPHVIMWLFGLVVGTIQFLIGVVIVLMFGIYMFYGGGSAFPNNDIVGDPLYDTSSLEKLIDLPFPPGNIAVSSTGRIFFTLHPEAHPPHSVYELKRTEANFEPYPSAAYQDNLISVLSIRIARDPEGNEILWILDYAHHGILHTPKLIGINIATNEEVHRHEFSSSVAPALAMMNDFQVDEAEQVIYIADAGIFRRRGGIIVYDIATQSEKRVLDGHPSVQAKKYKTSINSTDYKGDMIVLGVFTVRPNVDSIVLSRDGKWLYFASVNDNELHKVFTADLRDVHLSDEELAKRVTVFSNKTQSDGMTIDNEGNIYYGDMEHSAILRINMKHKTPITETLFQDDQQLRWPDGFSYGPDGYIYFTCSSLQHVIFKSAAHISENAPYHIFRFKSEFSAQPGQ